MKHALIFVLLCFGLSVQIYGQNRINNIFGKKDKHKIDSLKTTDYPYLLPIWGEKATQKGYQLPYSAGISTQYFASTFDLTITDLMVGFNDGTMYNIDNIVKFNKAVATGGSITVRPDVWLFPFLNVYGILGATHASTDIGFGVYLPDSLGTGQEITSAESNITFNTSTYGLGLTPAAKAMGLIVTLDMNIAWTKVPQLEKPTKTFVFAPRFVKSFSLKKENSSFAVWAGAFRVKIASHTSGSMALSEVFPEGSLPTGEKIESGLEKVENAQQEIDTWWNGLSDLQQNNPINKTKYDAANSAISTANNILNAADNALDNFGGSTVQYSMQKQVSDYWNLIVGSQYQYNRHIMLRVEAGFLGSRTQFMGGIQYRFGL